MTDIITQTPEHALQLAASEVGLSLIDIAQVLYVLQKTGGPQTLITCLESAIGQMALAGAALEATKAGLIMAIEQRNEANAALTDAQKRIEISNMHTETAKDDLLQLQTDLEQWNQNNPLIAALVNEVWTQAQADLIARMSAQEGV